MPRPQPAISRRFVHPARQSGVGLIEILVAILVVSIGLLGMAALQAQALTTNNSAMTRSLAILDTYYIIDAMRADRVNALAGAYDGTVTANACPNNQGTLAQATLSAWCTQLANDLGAQGTTTGTVACANANACTINIQFDDSRSGTKGSVGSAAQTVVTNAVL